MGKIMSDKHPKITQEALDAAATLILGCLSDNNYLKEAPYSSLMVSKINEVTDKFRNGVISGKFEAAASPDNTSVDNSKENAEIEKQFADLNADIEKRSSEYRDNYGILVRLEKIVRSMERMATNGSTDSVKMSAMSKFLDFQQQEMEILLQLTNIAKAQKIESITRRFFQEIKKYPDLEKIADRYLNLLNDMD